MGNLNREHKSNLNVVWIWYHTKNSFMFHWLNSLKYFLMENIVHLLRVMGLLWSRLQRLEDTIVLNYLDFIQISL